MNQDFYLNCDQVLSKFSSNQISYIFFGEVLSITLHGIPIFYLSGQINFIVTGGGVGDLLCLGTLEKEKPLATSWLIIIWVIFFFYH